jgi:HPt (histidine-containing phosphotransfer) domain-containing protein
MDDLRRTFRQALSGRIAALEAARAVMGSDDAASAVRRVAHALRGSGGTYGFPDITAAAAAVEDADEHDLAARLDELIALLRATATGSDAPAEIMAVEDEANQSPWRQE